MGSFKVHTQKLFEICSVPTELCSVSIRMLSWILGFDALKKIGTTLQTVLNHIYTLTFNSLEHLAVCKNGYDLLRIWPKTYNIYCP